MRSICAKIWSQPMNAMMQALSWSPHGNYLAALCHSQEKEKEYWRQICVFTRAGALQTRIDNVPQQQYPAGYSPKYHITWSEDEQYIYLLVKDDEVYRLVEADVQTGEIVRVLYENFDGLHHPDEYESETFFTWTDDLEYVVVGIGYAGWRKRHSLPTFSLNLTTGEEFDLMHIKKRAIPTCANFSPVNNYLVAINVKDNNFVLFNARGEIIHIVESVEADGVSCPTWQEDESAFYFTTEGLDIYQYSFIDAQLEQIFSNPYDYVISIEHHPDYPVVLSPDGTHLAFAVGVFGSVTTYNLMVLDLSTGEWYEYDTPPAAYPLWVPNEP